MKKAQNSIGIFDSGLGGLTILKEVRKVMPRENIIYFGDSAHVPYGSKSKETVTQFSLDIAKFLQSKKVKLILVACNTASALALPTLQKHISIPILGVITPGAKAATQTKNKNIFVIGTSATVKSEAYAKEIKKLNKQASVKQIACPLFVPLIEEGLADDKITKLAIEKYLAEVKKLGPCTLILGCTHYPVIKKNIAEFLPKAVLVDSAKEITKEAKLLLEKENLLNKTGKGKIELFVSDSPKNFTELAKKILGFNLKAKEIRFYI